MFGPPSPAAPDLKVIGTVRSAFETCRSLRRQNVGGVVALDIKGIHLGTEFGEIMFISLGDRAGNVYIFDVYKNPEILKDGGLETFLTSRQLIKVVHWSSAPCATIFWKIGAIIQNLFDTQVCHKIISESPTVNAQMSLAFLTTGNQLTDRTPSIACHSRPKTPQVLATTKSSRSLPASQDNVRTNSDDSEDMMRYRLAALGSQMPTISLRDVSYANSERRISTCTVADDGFRSLCQLYNIPHRSPSKLFEYKLSQLREYWRTRPVTEQMREMIQQDISPILKLYDTMTKCMDSAATAYIIECSDEEARSKIKSPGRTARGKIMNPADYGHIPRSTLHSLHERRDSVPSDDGDVE